MRFGELFRSWRKRLTAFPETELSVRVSDFFSRKYRERHAGYPNHCLIFFVIAAKKHSYALLDMLRTRIDIENVSERSEKELIQPILLNLTIQGFPVDIQQFCRFGFVVFRLDQSIENRFALGCFLDQFQIIRIGSFRTHNEFFR